jgi:hypothetical protein
LSSDKIWLGACCSENGCFFYLLFLSAFSLAFFHSLTVFENTADISSPFLACLALSPISVGLTSPNHPFNHGWTQHSCPSWLDPAFLSIMAGPTIPVHED